MNVATGPSTLTLPDGRALPVNAGSVEVRDRQGNVTGETHQIAFPNQGLVGTSDEELRKTWALAGIRIDPGAPGLTKDMFNTFGKSPQVRLTLQPFHTDRNDQFEILDGSLHLVYAFHDSRDANATCPLHNRADMDAFGDFMDDVVALKARLERDHGIVTDGQALGVHPAFESAAATAALQDGIKDLLQNHITPVDLFAVSVAGIPDPRPEPWIFVAMQRSPATGRIEAFPSPAIVQPGPAPIFGQMLNFTGRGNRVDPFPATSNSRPVGCGINMPGQVPAQIEGAGFSTAAAFDDPGFDTDGNRFGQSDAKFADIVNAVADPARGHFFNTDCVSCHTETRKELDLILDPALRQQRFASIARDEGLHPDVVPKSQWNVRAFGWFPGTVFFSGAPAQPTIARRAARETKEVVECFATEHWDNPDRSCLDH
jgi:hypothetical protein